VPAEKPAQALRKVRRKVAEVDSKKKVAAQTAADIDAVMSRAQPITPAQMELAAEPDNLPVPVANQQGLVMEVVDRSPKIREGLVVLETMRELTSMVKHYMRAGMVPRGLEGRNQAETEARVAVAIEYGMALGFTSLQSMAQVCIVNNRPSLWGDALLSLCLKHSAWAGQKVEWTGTGENRVCTYTCFRMCQGQAMPYTVSFGAADAKRAGLLGKPGPWQQYPDRMMLARARAFALRDSFPDALQGAVGVEEMEGLSSSQADSATEALQAKLELQA